MSEAPRRSADTERLFGRIFLLLVVIIPSLILVLPAVVGSLVLFLRGDDSDFAANFTGLMLIGGLFSLFWMLGALVLILLFKLALVAWSRLRRPQ
ncbi:MAG: hypothetical protein WBA73_14195 [Devosia sp.]